MSKLRTIIPTTGDFNLFCQRILKVEHAEDVLAIISALDESCAEIDAQRTMRQRDGSASEGWLQASASALKYCGLKLKAARAHYDDLIHGKPSAEFSPEELWLVTLCNNASDDIYTQISSKHPAEFFLDELDALPPEERSSLVLFNSVKVPPSAVAKAQKFLSKR